MARVKLGMIGCGSIAQLRHLPNARELPHLIEIAALSDLSPRLLERIGDDYGVPADRRYTDYRGLIESDVDAVIVGNFGSHVAPALAAAEAGKHVLVEKPACTTVREAEALVEAAARSGKTMMVAYMKRYDPGYEYARRVVESMSDVRLIFVSQLHPDNTWHPQLGGYYDPAPQAQARELNPSNADDPHAIKMYRFDDIPRGVREAEAAAGSRAVAEALGMDDPPGHLRRAFSLVNGSMIHDIGNLHGMFGPQRRVVHTDIWAGGAALTTTIDYGDDRRCVCNRVDLPDVWDWEEKLAVYGSRERVVSYFPHGLEVGLPTTVEVHGAEPDGKAWKKELSWHDSAFKAELRHFAECARTGRKPNTPIEEVVADIALVRDIVLAHAQAGSRSSANSAIR